MSKLINLTMLNFLSINIFVAIVLFFDKLSFVNSSNLTMLNIATCTLSFFCWALLIALIEMALFSIFKFLFNKN